MRRRGRENDGEREGDIERKGRKNKCEKEGDKERGGRKEGWESYKREREKVGQRE